VPRRIDPLIAMGRQPHYPSLAERFEDTPPPSENLTPVEAMAYRLKTPDGRKLYALRKQVPEPVFASSSRCWASGSSCCAVSIGSKANGAL